MRTQTLRTETESRRWNELRAEIKHHLTVLNEESDRIRQVWSLKLIAECIADLDEIDRQQGYLPLQVRPPFMLHPKEAALVLKHFHDGKDDNATLAVTKRLDRYIDGRLDEFAPADSAVDH